jgi:hypothetical protein
MILPPLMIMYRIKSRGSVGWFGFAKRIEGRGFATRHVLGLPGGPTPRTDEATDHVQLRTLMIKLLEEHQGAATTDAETPHHECYLSQGDEAAASLNVLSRLDRLYVEIQHERSACEWLRS